MSKFLSILQAIHVGLQAEMNAIPITTTAGKVVAIALVAESEVETFIQAFQAVKTTAPATTTTTTTTTAAS